MRKILSAFALLFLCASGWAQTATVTGRVVDPGNTGQSVNTVVLLTLRGCGGNQPRYNGSALLWPVVKKFWADASGNISGTIFKSDSITCGTSTSSSYWEMVVGQNGQLSPPCNVRITASTFDATQPNCLNVNPAIAVPSDSTLYARVDASNLPFTGNVRANGKVQATPTAAKASGESFYATSGEAVFGLSDDVTEASATLTGTDFTPSSAYVALKFTTSASASFIQGLKIRVKKNGAITNTSYLAFALYSDVAGVPTTNMSSGGYIYAGQVTTSMAEYDVILQNVTTALSPNTAYWVVITRGETGGNFVIDTGAGTGTSFQGAALGALSDVGTTIYHKIMARSLYGAHFSAPQSHAVWGVSVNGVGVRGDSTSHYGVYGQSVSNPGVRGTSTYQAGVIGTSTNGNGLEGETSSTTGFGIKGTNLAGSGGYAGVYGVSTSGPGVIGGTSSAVPVPVGLKADASALQFGPGSNSYLYAASAVPTSGQHNVGEIFFNQAIAGRGGAAAWVVTTSGVPGLYAPLNVDGISGDRGDANQTLVVGTDAAVQLWETQLTANRTVTLSTTGAYNGARFRIVRTGLGAFTLDVGGLKTIPNSTAAFVDVMYNGSAWKLTAYGTL